MQNVKAIVVKVSESHLEVLISESPVWWLGNQATVKLPKNNEVRSAKVGDEITITLT